MCKEYNVISYLCAGCGTNGKGKKLRGMLAAVELYLCKGCSVTLDGLRDATFARVELHCALDLERAGVRAVAGDTNKRHPLVVGAYAVVDDLGPRQRGVSVEHFGRGGGRVGDGPVIHRGVGNQPQCRV